MIERGALLRFMDMVERRSDKMRKLFDVKA